MTTRLNVIESSNALINIDQNFKIVAGPGAGKTYWIVNHIKQVLGFSSRLFSGARVACISYTTVASEEIILKLERTDQVEVSTIHSFLYKNIVKPYVHLACYDDGRRMVMDLHSVEEHRATPGKIHSWNKRYLTDNMELAMAAAEDLTWRLDEGGTLQLVLRRPYLWSGKFLLGKTRYSFPNNAIDYKQLYWNEGRIHHEDVLYFAYRILSENPRLVMFLSARFPYVFIDEFQDTNPIQTWIIHRLAEQGSIIGVIGDVGQSIYGFADASVGDFIAFQLPGQEDYTIQGNRRSTFQIIDFLNVIRGERLTQTCVRNKSGSPVTLLVGELHGIIATAKSLLPKGTTLHVLARNRALVTKIGGGRSVGENVWNKM
ncbi:MAG: UvrD-helicase domain-containing protein [Bacilli bacterium]